MSECEHKNLTPVTATCAACEMSAHQIIHQAQARVKALEAVQARLIDWIQHDCPFSSEQILRIATKEAGHTGEGK